MDETHFQFNTIEPALLAIDTRLGYDAVKDKDRRRPAKRVIYPQDTKLQKQYRERAIATSQDLQQNFAAAAWAIRKHLDYVSMMVFQSQTGDEAADTAVEAFMRMWDQRNNCDVRRRHSLRRQIRLAEARRTVDGDFYFLKIGGTGPDRGKLQAVEAYRITQPSPQDIGVSNQDMDNWVEGVELNAKGSVRRYAIHRRNANGTAEFEKTVPAMNLVSLGYYERFDQVRGISPLLAGLNSFQDVYEGIDYALAKMKLSQIFGLTFYRDAEMAEDYAGGPVGTKDTDSDGIADAGYDYDFGAGPQVLDLLPGDKAEFLESRTPAAETVDFMRFVLSVALKSLDLPDSFLRETDGNFFGNRSALQQYLRSAESKQQDLIEVLDEITRWRLGIAIADGEVVLPGRMSFDDLRWEWSPKGNAWWNPVQEATGAKSAIAAGLDNIERVTRANGTDVKTNIDVNAKWQRYAEEQHGMTLQWATSTSANLSETTDNE